MTEEILARPRLRHLFDIELMLANIARLAQAMAHLDLPGEQAALAGRPCGAWPTVTMFTQPANACCGLSADSLAPAPVIGGPMTQPSAAFEHAHPGREPGLGKQPPGEGVEDCPCATRRSSSAARSANG
jgi:hypothetical protein